MIRRVVWLGLALALAGALVVAWLPDPLPVDVRTATVGPMRVTVDGDGRTRVKDRHVVSAPFSGSLARIELHPGDHVAEGAVVARLAPLPAPLLDARTRTQAEARVAAARIAQKQALSTIARAALALDYADRDVARQRQLASRHIATPQTLDAAELLLRTRREDLASARFAARVAEFEVRMAQAALGQLAPGRGEESFDVPAPVDGTVLRVLHASEGAVTVGTPLVELGDPAALEVVVDVLTADAVRIPPGAPVELAEWGGPHSLRGHVRRVEPSATTRLSALGVEEQRVNVLVDLDDPRERWVGLGDGYRVETAIVVWRSDRVLRVASSAVFRDGAGWAAFVVEGERAHRRTVTLDHRNGAEVEITGGLAAGEHVIVHPSDLVREGSSVRPRTAH